MLDDRHVPAIGGAERERQVLWYGRINAESTTAPFVLPVVP